MKVYLVKLDWSTEDSNDIELFVCDTYEKAYEKFKELIANEMNPETTRGLANSNGKTAFRKTTKSNSTFWIAVATPMKPNAIG